MLNHENWLFVRDRVVGSRGRSSSAQRRLALPSGELVPEGSWECPGCKTINYTKREVGGRSNGRGVGMIFGWRTKELLLKRSRAKKDIFFKVDVFSLLSGRGNAAYEYGDIIVLIPGNHSAGVALEYMEQVKARKPHPSRWTGRS